MRKLGKRKECNKKIDERDGATQPKTTGKKRLKIRG